MKRRVNRGKKKKGCAKKIRNTSTKKRVGSEEVEG